jgi:protein TonB
MWVYPGEEAFAAVPLRLTPNPESDMFTTLLECKATRPRSPFGLATSAALHGLVLFLAVRATLHATQPAANPAQKIAFIEEKTDAQPPKPAAPLSVPVRKGFRVLTAPVNIPVSMPDIDLARPATNPDDFRGVGPEGGRANGVDIPAPPNENQIYDASQVEKPASLIAGPNAPHYPDMLKAAGVEGDVVVSFVVDTTGRVDLSRLTIVRSTHTLFEAAVRAALPRMRFLPAEVSGRRVRQLVQLPFVFHIVK